MMMIITIIEITFIIITFIINFTIVTTSNIF